MAKSTNKKIFDSIQPTSEIKTGVPTGVLKKSYQPTSGVTTPPPTNQSSSGSGNSKGKK